MTAFLSSIPAASLGVLVGAVIVAVLKYGLTFENLATLLEIIIWPGGGIVWTVSFQENHCLPLSLDGKL